MTTVSDLPPSPAREVLREAEARGLEVCRAAGMQTPHSNSVFIAGLAAIIADLKAKEAPRE